MMKLFCSIAAAAALMCASIYSHADRQQLDKIVAVVDRSVIMQSELDKQLQQVVLGAQANNMALPDMEVLTSQVLDHLISEQLQLQMARRVNFSVSDEQVNAAIENIRLSNKLSPEQFERQLQQEGMSLPALREKVRKDLTIQQIQQGMVQQRIQISPLEIDNFLKSADARFWISPEYHLGHILIGLPQGASADQIEQARQKAQQLAQTIREGKPFAEAAIAESDGPAALEGGDLGWRKTSALPSLFAEIVPDLKVGDVSDPARSPAGFHLLTLYEKRGDEQQLQEQFNVRHILLKPSAILSDEEAKAKLENIRKKIQDGADFAAMAKEHSEDIGSMLAGGELGWSTPDMYVPAFAKAITSLPVGEISAPFQSRFGWHIVEVLGKRQEDITEAIKREKAARILTSRRFEDELQVWLRELRDETYVDIRL